MEATPRVISEVHVLRQTFRPSQPFGEGIENFVKPGETLPRLSLSGTKEAAVGLADYHYLMHKKVEDAARNEFKKLTEPIYIDPVMFYKFIGSSALRLAFIPTATSTPAFNKALDTLDAIPNLLPPFETTPRYFMYIDIPKSQLVSPEDVHDKYVSLRRALAGKTRTMYSVLPEDITGKDTRREIILPDIENTDESSLVSPL